MLRSLTFMRVIITQSVTAEGLTQQEAKNDSTLSTSYASLDFLKRVHGDQPLLVGLSLCGVFLRIFSIRTSNKYLDAVILNVRVLRQGGNSNLTPFA